jgi:hypothetical protein
VDDLLQPASSSRGCKKKKRVEPLGALVQTRASPFFVGKPSDAAPAPAHVPMQDSGIVEEADDATEKKRAAIATSHSQSDARSRGNPRCVGNILIDYMFIPPAPKNV